jgi:hypothetical protein
MDDRGEAYEVTDRGFRHYKPIETGYGHQVSVYESSSAAEPAIWLNIGPGQTAGGTAHMNFDQARRLIATLTAAIEGHYQTRGEPATDDDKSWVIEFDEHFNVMRVYRAACGVADSMGPELTSPAEVGALIDDLRENAVRYFGAAR